MAPERVAGAAEALALVVAYGDAHSPVSSTVTRAAVRAILQSRPEYRTPSLSSLLSAGRVALGARWPAGATPPGTCDP